MTKLSWIKLDAVHDWHYIALELQKQDCVTERLLVQILGASGKRDWGLLSLLVTEGAILNTPAQVKLLKDNQSLTGSKTAGSPFSPFWPLTAAWGKHTCSQQYSIVSIEVLTHTHTHIENKRKTNSLTLIECIRQTKVFWLHAFRQQVDQHPR